MEWMPVCSNLSQKWIRMRLYTLFVGKWETIIVKYLYNVYTVVMIFCDVRFYQSHWWYWGYPEVGSFDLDESLPAGESTFYSDFECVENATSLANCSWSKDSECSRGVKLECHAPRPKRFEPCSIGSVCEIGTVCRSGDARCLSDEDCQIANPEGDCTPMTCPLLAGTYFTDKGTIEISQTNVTKILNFQKSHEIFRFVKIENSVCQQVHIIMLSEMLTIRI